MDSHVLSVRQSCYHHLKCISRIRRYLTLDATKSLVNALVTSRLDYANSLLSGLSEGLIGKLQKVQNYSARVVSKVGRRSHITPVLASLHWLPVKFHLQYKLLLLVHKSLKAYMVSFQTISPQCSWNMYLPETYDPVTVPCYVCQGQKLLRTGTNPLLTALQSCGTLFLKPLNSHLRCLLLNVH